MGIKHGAGLIALLAAALPGLLGAAPAQDALCTQGRRQSPIDITATQRLALPPLQFDYHAAPLYAVNDGHTVRLRFGPGSRLRIGSESHTLQQFHFHTPGGDRVQGEDFALAVHLLHKSRAGQLISLVLLYRLGAENAALAALLPRLPGPGQGPVQRADLRVDPATLLPASRGYYAYDGSLTGPPCTEGVAWIVMKEPLQLSAAQLAAFKRLFADNARPVQPLNGRVVRESL